MAGPGRPFSRGGDDENWMLATVTEYEGRVKFVDYRINIKTLWSIKNVQLHLCNWKSFVCITVYIFWRRCSALNKIFKGLFSD